MSRVKEPIFQVIYNKRNKYVLTMAPVSNAGFRLPQVAPAATAAAAFCLTRFPLELSPLIPTNRLITIYIPWSWWLFEHQIPSGDQRSSLNSQVISGSVATAHCWLNKFRYMTLTRWCAVVYKTIANKTHCSSSWMSLWNVDNHDSMEFSCESSPAMEHPTNGETPCPDHNMSIF